MKVAALLSLLAASASAFAPASSVQKSTALHAEMSKSLPFLLKPKNLEGYVGADAGFDPLGFSNYFDMKWLREAELKHGRSSMLATVGFVMQQFWTLPGMTVVCGENVCANQATCRAPSGWAPMQSASAPRTRPRIAG